QVASAEMANVAHITGKAGLKFDSVWIDLNENLEVPDLRFDLDACEVLQAAEGNIVVQGLQLDIIAQRQQVRLCRLVEIDKLLVRIREILRNGLLARSCPGCHLFALGVDAERYFARGSF